MPTLIFRVVFVALFLLGAACSPKKPIVPKTVTVEEKIADEESHDELFDRLDDDSRIAARKTARDFLCGIHPNAKINGMAMVTLGSSLCFIRADVTLDKKRVVIPILVQRFWAENGDPYFRADLVQRELEYLVRLKSQEANLKRKFDEGAEIGRELADE
jgi:hypothetical protein